MKNVFLILTIALTSILSGIILAQAPEKMSYQAVIRDASNNLLNNASVSMRISILQGSASGSSVYIETHATTSNANGLVTIEIGAGTIVSGSFSNIDWANGPYYIKSETDPSGGTNYSLVSTSQLMSVPYALHAKNTDSWSIIADSTFTNKTVSIGTVGGSSSLNIRNQNTGGHISLTSPLNTTFTRLFNRGFSIIDTTENSALSFSFYPIGSPSTLSINNEPTYSFFIGTEFGQGQHINFRIGGFNRFWISGRGVTTVNSVMKLVPINSAPSNPEKGMMYMDNTTNKLRVYDGTTWQNCW
jgi:hypothetical protein